MLKFSLNRNKNPQQTSNLIDKLSLNSHKHAAKHIQSQADHFPFYNHANSSLTPSNLVVGSIRYDFITAKLNCEISSTVEAGSGPGYVASFHASPQRCKNPTIIATLMERVSLGVRPPTDLERESQNKHCRSLWSKNLDRPYCKLKSP